MNTESLLRVLSLGAGVQSSTIALMAERGEIDKIDAAIFADTESEPAYTYKWLDFLESQLSYPVYKVSSGNLSEKALQIKISKNGNKYCQSSPPAWVIEGSGKPILMMRQCTFDFKIKAINKKLRELGGKEAGVEQLLGISIDEVHRMKPSREKWITNRWILIEKKMTRQDCLIWMKKHGYPEPPRSSCWLCPYHSDGEWRQIKKTEPESFARAIKWERDFQKTMTEVKGFRGIPFLHRSCIPLSEINFNVKSNQLDMFTEECEGICGV